MHETGTRQARIENPWILHSRPLAAHFPPPFPLRPQLPHPSTEPWATRAQSDGPLTTSRRSRGQGVATRRPWCGTLTELECQAAPSLLRTAPRIQSRLVACASCCDLATETLGYYSGWKRLKFSRLTLNVKSGDHRQIYSGPSYDWTRLPNPKHRAVEGCPGGRRDSYRPRREDRAVSHCVL